MKHFTAFLYFECNFFGFCLGKNKQLERCTAFSNKFCGESVQHEGAIDSYRKIAFEQRGC